MILRRYSNDKGPAFRTLNLTFELVFKSERVFCDFQNSIFTSFFVIFVKFGIELLYSKLSINSECSETPVSELFPNFLTQKQGFLTHKQEIISELISKLFLRNFCEFKKLRFFPKKFQTLKTEHFRNLRKQKVRKFPSNAGP